MSGEIRTPDQYRSMYQTEARKKAERVAQGIKLWVDHITKLLDNACCEKTLEPLLINITHPEFGKAAFNRFHAAGYGPTLMNWSDANGNVKSEHEWDALSYEDKFIRFESFWCVPCLENLLNK